MNVNSSLGLFPWTRSFLLSGLQCFQESISWLLTQIQSKTYHLQSQIFLKPPIYISELQHRREACLPVTENYFLSISISCCLESWMFEVCTFAIMIKAISTSKGKEILKVVTWGSLLSVSLSASHPHTQPCLKTSVRQKVSNSGEFSESYHLGFK